MTEKRYKRVFEDRNNLAIFDEQEQYSDKGSLYLTGDGIVDLLNSQEERNRQLQNQIKIFELFLDGNNLDIEWDLFCTKEDGCPFIDASCQECIYLGIKDSDVE